MTLNSPSVFDTVQTIAPTWQFSLQKNLRHGARQFNLDWQFQSKAKRIVLLGPSGAGKSQSVKMIAGLSKPDAGRIALTGRVLFDSAKNINLPPQQRQLGLLFQDYALFPHLTVLQNICFALQVGWRNPLANTKLQQQESVRHWLEKLEIAEFLHQYPHQLSGGQKQRVALARTLLAKPQALLLDEPFAALDARTRANMRAQLHEWLLELDLPLILISHDEEDVSVFAEAVIRLEAGRCA